MLQGNEIRPLDFCRRTVGKQAIERSMMALALRVARFQRHRASSPESVAWAARTFDRLGVAIRDEDRP